MSESKNIQYQRIAEAIDYIKTHFNKQPQLDEIAQHVHLSPYHFQRLFKNWAGTTPKKFLQYISIQHAKQLLLENQQSLFSTTDELGLSSTSRLHELFIQIEGMSPAEYKNGGKNLHIQYDFTQSPFGLLIVANTSKGICHMAFDENEEQALQILHLKFPQAKFSQETTPIQHQAIKIFQGDWNNLSQIKLHLKGTEFQFKVWETLLKIPMGNLKTYGNIANTIGHPSASRAVGTAIGSNPVAYLIPCHRVIQSSGLLGGYMWGTTRKSAIIAWESAQNDQDKEEPNQIQQSTKLNLKE